MSTDISFITLSWNSDKYLQKCCNSIALLCSKENIDFEILIVDNGSTDNSATIIEQLEQVYHGKIKPIFLKSNSGTTISRNMAIKKARGMYVCICDSDTEFMSGSIRQLLKILDINQVAMVAPQLYLENGEIQHSVKKFPTFLHKLSKMLGVFWEIRAKGNDLYKDFPFTEIVEVESAISACWFFKNELPNLIGFLDENIFYAPEDLDYCQRIKYAGKKIVYYPLVRVLHHTQRVSYKSPFSKISLGHFIGLLYYYRKHGGWFSTNHLRHQQPKTD